MPGYDSEFAFHLDGYTAADAAGDRFWQTIAINQDMLTSLAEHHTPDGRSSYYVLYNAAATWGHPGRPQLLALHLQRDTAARTFTFDHAELPIPAMAQSWLIARGCPKEAIRSQPDAHSRPADAATTALEERVMGDGDHFAMLGSHTSDTGPDLEVTVLLRALDERARPFRVLLEEHDLDAGTHSLREGAFDTLDRAVAWLRTRNAPLPTAPSPRPPAPPPPSSPPPRRR